MSSSKILLSDHDAGIGQVGGGAFLEDISLWPRAPDTGEMMTPLMTITERFFSYKSVPEGMALTVFVALQRQDGQIDVSTSKRYAVHRPAELEQVRASGYSRVLVHRLSERPLWPTPDTLVLPSKFINVQDMTEDEAREDASDLYQGLRVSKLLGSESWLHEPVYGRNRYNSLLQLLEYDIIAWSPEHRGLFAGGIGYLHLDMQARRGKEGDEGGYFFIQASDESTGPIVPATARVWKNVVPIPPIVPIRATQGKSGATPPEDTRPTSSSGRPMKFLWSDQDRGFGHIGGGAFLEDMALWPAVPDTGEPMTPLITLSEQFLPARFLSDGMALTVFVAVKRQQVTLDLSVGQQSELGTVRKAGYSRVMLHRRSDQEHYPAPGTPLLQRTFIDFAPMSDEEIEADRQDEDSGNGLSKPQGRPQWLQDPIDPAKHHVFLLQLTEYDIADWAPAHEGLLVDGIGYLYVDQRTLQGKEGNEGGYFFIQYT